MLDYCGEIEFYPYNGDNDNYDSYEPNLGGVEFVKAKYQFKKKLADPFVKDSNYYHRWESFDKIIERDTCFSILRDDMWINIPKKIVKGLRETEILAHTLTFLTIVTTAHETRSGDKT